MHPNIEQVDCNHSIDGGLQVPPIGKLQYQ